MGGIVMATTINAAASAGLVTTADTSQILQLQTGGTTAVTIDASQNVGIGTSSPSYKLDVRTSVDAVQIYASNGTVQQAVGYCSAGLALSGTISNHPVGLITNNTERMRILNTGQILVGATTAPASATGAAVIYTASSFAAAIGYYCHAGASAGNTFSNTFNFFWTGSSLQAWIDSINIGTVTLVSDYRIKKDIVTQDTPAIARINQLRPVTYERTDYKELYKADGVAREGFIAHELQAIIPSAVEGEKDCENQIQSLNLDALCSVMVKAIQEQQTIIEALTARLTALEAK